MNNVQNFLKKNSTYSEIVAEVQNDTFQMEEIFKLNVKDLKKSTMNGIINLMPLTKNEITNDNVSFSRCNSRT